MLQPIPTKILLSAVTVGALSVRAGEPVNIVDGRSLMQYNSEARELFNKDQAGDLKAAETAWRSLAEEKDR